MSAAPIRFEEVAYNCGFMPVDPITNRGYCLVYRLYNQCMDRPGRTVLIRGNERIIQMKDISGPIEDREKITIFSQDIVDYYPFNFKSKAVGFLIQAKRRSKTGYWFIVFRREGQLAAFCSFLYWLIHGHVPRPGRSLSPHCNLHSPSRCYNSPPRRHSPPWHCSGPRYQICSGHNFQRGSRHQGHESVVVSCNSSSFSIQYPRSRRSSCSPPHTYYEPSTYHRRSSSIGRPWYR